MDEWDHSWNRSGRIEMQLVRCKQEMANEFRAADKSRAVLTCRRIHVQQRLTNVIQCYIAPPRCDIAATPEKKKKKKRDQTGTRATSNQPNEDVTHHQSHSLLEEDVPN